MKNLLWLIVLIPAALLLSSVVRTQERLPAAAPAAAERYTDPAYDISFVPPRAWGGVSVRAGSSACPEEDTYRTGDTLSRFDREYAFPDLDLPDTETFIRAGIRVYTVTASQEACQDGLLRALAAGTDPRTISSVWLEPAPAKGIATGVYNGNASRLDTEYRAQYTYFKRVDGGVLAVQPYFSVIPYAGSPEAEEINTSYRGDIAGYVARGATAALIREELQRFRELVAGMEL